MKKQTKSLVVYTSVYTTAGMIMSACAGGPTPVSTFQRMPERSYASKIDSVSINEIKASANCPVYAAIEKETDYKKLMSFANGCIAKEQWSAVDQLGERMDSLQPDLPWGAYYMSVSSENRNHIERAQWMIDLALKKAPKIGLLKYQLGRILWTKKFYKESLSYMESAIELDPKINDAYVFLGQVYLRELNFDKSQKYFEKALSNDSKNISVIFGLASCYVENEKAQDALSLLQKGISNFPRALPFRLQEVYVYENLLKQLDLALNKYKEIQSLVAKNKVDGSVPFNIQEKIKTLETALSKRTLAAK